MTVQMWDQMSFSAAQHTGQPKALCLDLDFPPLSTQQIVQRSLSSEEWLVQVPSTPSILGLPQEVS